MVGGAVKSGAWLGLTVGLTVNKILGVALGFTEGIVVGLSLNSAGDHRLGCAEGKETNGIIVGNRLGTTDGLNIESTMGAAD